MTCMKHVAPLLVAAFAFATPGFAEVPRPAPGPDSPEALSIPPLPPSGKVSTPPPARVATPKPQPEDPIVTKALALIEAGKLLTADAFAEQLTNPQHGTVALTPAKTKPLPGREIARQAAASYLRAGWIFQCTKCGRWHTNFAGGYAIANDAVATAHHVMQPPETMKPGAGHPIFVRGENEVLPVTSVIAADGAMDAIVLRVGVSDLQPLPLASDLEIGDPVWCLSDPRGERGYFSNGIVNRWVAKAANDPRRLRLNVSTDWAPGSSGSAVLDQFGNAVGHVGSIRALYSKPNAHAEDGKAGTAAAQAMNLHEAIPARSLRTLLP